MSRLTQREKILLAIVVGAIVLLVNLWLIGSLSKWNDSIHAGLAAKQIEIKSMKALLAASDQWATRDAWLNSVQPKLTNPEQASVQLLEQIKEAARANDVTLENQELGSIETQSACKSVSVQIVTKSSWENLVKFLHAMQQPDKFIVFETATLQIDPGNASRMACRFKISKWYAL